MKLKDRILTPRVARALMAASAIVSVGAGAAAGILVGGGATGAVVLGALAWVVRVGLALPKRPEKFEVRADDLSEPWRGYVRDAEDARSRFEEAVLSTKKGPLRDRLTEIAATLDHGVDECRRIATRGQSIASARRKIRAAEIQRDLDQLPRGDREPTRATREALNAQLDTAARMDDVIRDARDRLQLQNARMDESVARAIELSVKADDLNALEGLNTSVGDLVNDLEALRLALDEPAMRFADS